jgi:hypothetical protein
MLRALRFLGPLAVHTVVAIIGTAIAEGAIWRLVPAHSVVGVECIFGTTLATLIGVGNVENVANFGCKVGVGSSGDMVRIWLPD